TAITNIETGARSVSTLELTKFADLYACQPASFLEERPNIPDDVSVVLMRSLQQVSNDPGFREAIDHVLMLCREGMSLKALLDDSREEPLPGYSIRLASAGDAVRQAVAIALGERRSVVLGKAPIAKIASV